MEAALVLRLEAAVKNLEDLVSLASVCDQFRSWSEHVCSHAAAF